MSEIKLIFGDCLEKFKDIANKSIDLIFTDPPYELDWKEPLKFKDRKDMLHHTEQTKKWDNVLELYPILFKEFDRIVKDAGSILMFVRSEHISYPIKYAKENNFEHKATIIWHKCLSGKINLFAKINSNIYLSSIRRLYKSSWLKNSTIELLTPNGEWRKIKYFTKNKKRTSGKIIYLRNGSKIRCTDNHKFSLNKKFIQAKKLKIGDILDTNINKLPIDKNLLFGYDEGWLIGLFIAEGNYQKNNELRFSLHKKETCVYDKLSLITNKYGGRIRKHIYNNSMAIIINSNTLFGIAKEYVKDKGALFKHLSSYCWETNIQFLSGIFDGWLIGDGCYSIKNNRYRVRFTRNILLNRDMKALANILGYEYISQETVVHSFGKIYKSIYAMIRKKKNNHHNCKSQYTILKIRNVNTESYEISLEKNHLFLLYDGVITHNSNPCPQVRKRNYLSSFETLIWEARFSEEKIKFTFNFKKQNEMHNFIEMPLCGGNERTCHPTQKPLKLIKHFLEIHSNKDDLILDPFFGSGTTAVACKLLDRNFIGFEINENYYNLAKERLEKTEIQNELNI